jgi:hypothetical protein
MSQTPRPNKTLDQAIADADAHLTILDDRIDVDDAAVFRWLRGHELHKGHFRHLVIGSQPLPAGWEAARVKVASEPQANSLLQPVGHDPAAIRTLTAALLELDPQTAIASGADAAKKAVLALASGRMWAIEARHAPHSRFATRTSPTAFAPINPRYGTKVEFTFIAKLEGDQWLRGYVPLKRTGMVIGRSGMTVASGFDIGQRSAAELSSFGFPPALLAKLKPFANQPFKGRTKEQVAATVATLGPVPILTKPEADLCDGAVFASILGDALANWNANAMPGVPAFTQLPAGWQTVWLSRFYQEGPATHVALGRRFRAEALQGQWAKAVATLKSYTEYTARAKAEAALLEADLPPAPKEQKQ